MAAPLLPRRCRRVKNLVARHYSQVGCRGCEVKPRRGQAVHKAALRSSLEQGTKAGRAHWRRHDPAHDRPSQGASSSQGLWDDPTFGPVVVFGHGARRWRSSTTRRLHARFAKLAHDLAERTRVSRLLHAYRDVPKQG
jgi:hypothetical protein